MVLKAFLKLFEMPHYDGQAKVDEFFEEFIQGRRLPVYADGRRVPLEIFNSPFRLLLVSQDPKHRNRVYAARGFHTKAEIVVREWPEDGSIPDVRPARDKAWHHWPVVRKLFPPLAPDPTYLLLNSEGDAISIPGFVTAFLRHCRSGQQPVFAGNMQIPPELFDHPFAAHLLISRSDDPGRKLVRDRWGRRIKGKVTIIESEHVAGLVEQVKAMEPHLAPHLYVFE